MANRAAFARADVADSKRGFPAVDLRGYAEARGLEFLDHATAAGYRTVLPCDEERQFNVVRGALPGGAYGVMAHEALAIGWTDTRSDWSGGFHGVRVTTKGGGSLLSFVPVVGTLFGGPSTAVVRVPCTVAGVRVPEV